MINEISEKLSLKVGFIFSKANISPNSWTLLSLIFGVLGFFSLFYNNLIFALIFFFIAGFLDLVDGSVARVMGRTTNFGAYLDGIIDRYVEGLLYLGLIIYSLPSIILPSYFWIALLMFGSFLTSYSKAYADHRKAVSDVKILGEKWKGTRATRLILIYIGFLFGIMINLTYFSYILIIAAILTNFNALQRIIFVYKNRKD